MAEGEPIPGYTAAPAIETADVQAAAEAAPADEAYILMTQQTLGRFVEKPRLMEDRLRKPPFRFLFDVAVEVARQTGFGLSELFGGTLPAKPQVPNDREGKIAFLDQWVHLLQWALGPPTSGYLTSVKGINIVCGIAPDWTNYMLQCTASAAWPDQVAAAPVQQASPELDVSSAPLKQEVPSPQLQDAESEQVAAPSLEPLAGPPSAAEQMSAQEQGVLEPAPVEPSPTVMSEAAKALDEAPSIEFGMAMDEFNALHEQMASTAAQWNTSQSAGANQALGDEDSDDSADIEAALAAPLSPGLGGPSEAESVLDSAARAALTESRARVARVDEKIAAAQDLIAQIEEGFDRTDAFAQEKWAKANAAKQQAEAEAEGARREQEEAARAVEEEAKRHKAEKKARRRAKKEEEARLKAEEAAKPVYPVSKYAQEHGARIVSMLGSNEEEEYAMDFDEYQADEASPTAQPEETPLVTPANANGAAGFDLSAALGDDPRGPEPTSSLGVLAPQGQGGLFEKLKLLMKETYVSYLCASMPSTLMKQYQPAELVGCLQFLLTELRKALAQHNLEDVVDEEPTTLAEDLHEKFPDDWLLHVLDPSAMALCGGKYDVSELLDTLQNLAQVAVDRLEDSLGPIQSWADETSPLRYVPPAEPLTVDSPPSQAENEELISAATNSGGPTDGPWSSALAPAPWEEMNPHVPPHHAQMHMAATVADFRQASASPVPTFDATLGPALWEQDHPVPVTASGPHAGRYATAAPGMRGAHTAAPNAAFGMRGQTAMPHGSSAYGRPAVPATSHGVPQRNYAMR